MKSPWQLGFLALALTGVSAYDFFYFKNRSQVKATQPAISAPAAEAMNPSIEPASEPVAITNGSSLPPISRDALNALAQQSYVPGDDDTIVEDRWPRRDPFSSPGGTVRMSSGIAESSPQREIPAPAAPQAIHNIAAGPAEPVEPRCVFSGALIQDDERIALVDGEALTTGAQLGAWKLVRIEPDHIILQAGRETRRIELNGGKASL